MKIKINSWFKLPFLGADVFPKLRAERVGYQKGSGFRFTALTNVPMAISVISEALGELLEVEGYVEKEQGLEKQCFICGEPIKLENVEVERTICDNCMKSEDAYSLYVLKMQELNGNIK